MLRVFIAVEMLLFSCVSFARTEVECLNQLALDTKHTTEQITKILMECNNLFLDGQFVYLRGTNAADKLIRKRWPYKDSDGNDAPVTQWEKSERILQYSECEGIAANLKTYMKQCEAKNEQQKEK